ncbi:hypothetical protein KKA00_00780 [bacterium]|nr:hypothetical protein [bacterium]MBU1650725.1 hypothetical protein [bacterium]
MKARWIIAVLITTLLIPQFVGARDRYEDLQKTIPFEKLDELQVDIDIGIAELIIGKAKSNNILEADITYKVKRGEPDIRFRKSGKIGYLSIESGDKGNDINSDNRDHGDEVWELLFTDKIPITFTIDVGLVDGMLNMTGLRIIDLDISGGLSDIDLEFDEPNKETIDQIRIEVGLGDFKGYNLGNANFKSLKVECGLGSATLDLTGDWRIPEAEMDIEVGLGSAKVEIPSRIGVEVMAEESFLSSVNLDRELREVRDGIHRSANWNDAKSRISIDAQVGLGSVKIRLID